jgi:hypothetical protein
MKSYTGKEKNAQQAINNYIKSESQIRNAKTKNNK